MCPSRLRQLECSDLLIGGLVLLIGSSRKQIPEKIYWRITPEKEKGRKENRAGGTIRSQCRSSEVCASPMGCSRIKATNQRHPQLGRSEDSLYITWDC